VESTVEFQMMLIRTPMRKLRTMLARPQAVEIAQRIREIVSIDLPRGSSWTGGLGELAQRRSSMRFGLCTDGGPEAVTLRRGVDGDTLGAAGQWDSEGGARWPQGGRAAPRGVHVVVTGSGMITRSTRIASGVRGNPAATARWEILSQLKHRNKRLPILVRREEDQEDRWTAVAVPRSTLDAGALRCRGLNAVEYTFAPFAAAALSTREHRVRGVEPPVELVLHVTGEWAVLGIGRGGALEIVREVPALARQGWTEEGLGDVVRTLEFYRFRMRGDDIARVVVSKEDLREQERSQLERSFARPVVDVRELASKVIGEAVPSSARALAIGAALAPGFRAIDESVAAAGRGGGRSELKRVRRAAMLAALPLALLLVGGHQWSRGSRASESAAAVEARIASIESRIAALAVVPPAPAPEQPARPPDALDAVMRVAASIPAEMVAQEISCISATNGPVDVAPTRLDLRLSLAGEEPETALRALDHYFDLHAAVAGWSLRSDPVVEETMMAGAPAIDLRVSFDTTVEGL